MNWTFHPENKDLTTSLPLSVEVRDWSGKPQVILDQMGEVELKEVRPGVMRADFSVVLPGTYSIMVRDSAQSFEKSIVVTEHEFFSFQKEFGLFTVLFIFVIGGIVIWTRNLMRKKTPETSK